MDGAVAIGAPSGLIACEAADGAAVFGASARGGVEPVEAGVGGAVAIGGPSGLIACGAADGAAVFGASARGGVELVEAGVGGAVAIGGPSGLIGCEAATGPPSSAPRREAARSRSKPEGRARCRNWRPVRAGPLCEVTGAAAWFGRAVRRMPAASKLEESPEGLSVWLVLRPDRALCRG